MADKVLNGDRDKLGEYVRHMADLMGLRDWVVRVRDGNPDDDDHAACAQLTYGRKVLGLWFREGWEEWDARELRQTVTHELLHAHTNPIGLNTLNQLGPIISKSVYQVAWENMIERTEIATDGIATAWAETLPLPVVKDEQEAA